MDIFNYDFRTHVGLFLIYNVPYIISLIVVLLGAMIGVNVVDNWAEILFIKYWYDGHLFDNIYAWRIHGTLNFLIFIFNIFKSDE